MTRRRRTHRTLAVLLALGSSLALVTGCGSSDEGAPLSFDTPRNTRQPQQQASQQHGTGTPTDRTGTGSGRPDARVPETVFPTGPKASFTVQRDLEDGTRIGVTELRGAKSGFTGRVWVWAPKQYFDPAYAETGFPVLVALPGGRGYPTNYWAREDIDFPGHVSRWAEEGKSLPFIVVMPVLNPDAKFYYDGSDIPGQPKMGSWLTEDVPDFVRANFRTFASRDGWAFMGSSSGGFVGLKSVLRKPDRFKAVIASGPDLVPDSPLWKGHEKERQANNPERMAAALGRRPDTPANRVYVAFQIGTKEPGAAKLRAFMRAYTKGPLKTRLQVIQDGEHNPTSYLRGMDEGTMAWLSAHLQGPVPAEAPGSAS
ncbi:alpha/beta hydrolase-fold protein [Streptomyces sp. NPDC046275]|uniref:alpha/beta hydrolase n=1 Tax=Streptomyces sp. NPDC046275 TaxID=3157201 RepID=UPI0033F7C8A3